VTSISQSPNGRLIATSSTDGTLRLWSLDRFTQFGDIDFQVRGTQVLHVPVGSQAEAAGITDLDEVVQFDGQPFYDSRRRLLDGAYQPGQEVSITVRDRFQAGAKNRRLRLRLIPAADRVEPLLSLFIAQDGEWIIWTPDGHYDASSYAERYLGFHVNQGRETAALWITAGQFEKQLYRPEVIDEVLAEAMSLGTHTAAKPQVRVFTAPQANLARFRPPEVRMMSPSNGLQTRSRETTIRANIESKSSLPVTEVSLKVNGFPVTLESMIDGTDSTTLTQTIPLKPGKNAVVLTARTVEASSQEVRSTIYCDVPDARAQSGATGVGPEMVADEHSPNVHVLAVGISDYKRDNLDLEYAHRDAEQFAEAWKRQEGRLYRSVQTHVLINEQATRDNLMRAFSELLKTVQPEDRVVLFFSAHGITDDLNKYYLLSHEADPDALRVSAVPHSDITEAVNDLLSKQCQVLLFVDTCHAGGAVTGAKGAKGPSRMRQTTRNYWRDVGSVVFLSSLPAQTSFERPEWENGAFTEAFLEAMTFRRPADANEDHCLSISELQTYLENRVKELTNGRQSPTGRRDPDTPGYDIAVQVESTVNTD